jgi:hypothetical protein
VRRACLLMSLLLWLGAGRTADAASHCAIRQSADANLNAIVNEVFRGKAARLKQLGLISADFFAAIAKAKYEICADRIWDVVTLPGDAPTVIFDEQFLQLLAQESQVLILGQYLAQRYPNVQTLDLHAALMRHVLAQNIAGAKARTLPDIAQEVVGVPVDLGPYLQDEKVMQQIRNMFLHSLYFLVFHEFCHIKEGHLEKRGRINAMKDSDLPGGKTKSDLLVQIEKDADACSLELINRDEQQFKSSPISFVSVFMVASTQGVFNRVLETTRQNITHPGALERLSFAYQGSLKAIKGSKDEARYKNTLDGMYAHFEKVMALKPAP